MTELRRFCVAPLTGVQVRDAAAGDGSLRISGYAAVFDQETVLYDGSYQVIKERINPRAFDKVLRDQPMRTPSGVVHFNLGHDMNSAVAATDVDGVGGLQLRANSKGLFYDALVDQEDPDAVKMAAKIRRGVIKQASFAFTVATSKWTDVETDDGPDESTREILELKHLYDVCACAQGAYPQTVSLLRSLAAAIGVASPGRRGGRLTDHERWQARMRVRLAASRHHHPVDAEHAAWRERTRRKIRAAQQRHGA